VKFKLKITKLDVITIVLLSIVFLSFATWNLGQTQVPTTTAKLTSGQSFYITLDAAVNVKSVDVLLKQGAMNVTVSAGSPDNWQDGVVIAWPKSDSGFSEDYYKWHETPLAVTTQYLKFNFTAAGGYNTNLAEIAVINQANQTVPIQSITNLSGDNPDLGNLIDEQTLVVYPADYMIQTYFDEIYFARTAEQYLNHQMPYEWTHPPLGKLIQAAGITAFGFSPFGWRIMGVIFATLMITLIYFLGKELLGSWIGGFAAAFLLTFDFMHFTMGRMGTADTYVIFFNIASQLFYFIYLKNVLKDGWKTSILPLVLSFVFFALGFSSKWLVLYGFVGELLLLLALRLNDVRKTAGKLGEKLYTLVERPYLEVLVLILVAVGIYFATYIPDMLIGRSPFGVFELQGAMYNYHSTLTATHPFSSPWYSWPLLFDPVNSAVHVPVWLQSANNLAPYGFNSSIVLLGNPAVWWVGFAAIVALTILVVPKFFRKEFHLKDHLPETFLVVVFFFQWVPYVLISRVVFLYHFYLNVPIMCLASAYFISKYWNKNYVKVLAVAYFAAVVALFILFLPVTTGVPTDPSIINSLRWSGTWVF
jgi:dolichyl-phosphate-mannose--protein O-mannosyl transferase